MRPLVLAGLLGFLAAPLNAWGPFSHAVFNERALARLGQIDATRFLTRGGNPAIFVGASSVCDLTFNVMALGKTHRNYDKLLHHPTFIDHLLEVAARRGDPASITFALAMRTHHLSDRLGNRGRGRMARNTFRWPLDRDHRGIPTRDPASTALEQLKSTTSNLNKILIDSMFFRLRRSECSYAPVIDSSLLTEALQTYSGARAVAHGTEAEKAQIRADIDSLAWKFTMSFQVLESVVRKLAENETLQAELRREFGIESDEALTGLDDCVDRIVEDVQDILDDKDLEPVSADPASDPWCGAGSMAGGLTSLSQSLLSVAWNLPQSYVAAGTDQPTDSRQDLKRRVYLTFFSAIAEPGIGWIAVRDRIRALVPNPPNRN